MDRRDTRDTRAKACGRCVVLLGAILFCFDTPTFRLIRLGAAHRRGGVTFTLALILWRGVSYVAAALLLAFWESWTRPSHQPRPPLDTRRTCLCMLLLATTGCAFPFAVSLTTAANVLVLISLAPLIAVLLSSACNRVLRTGLSQVVVTQRRTVIASVVSVISVVLVFSGSVSFSAGRGLAENLIGCALALCACVAQSSLLVLANTTDTSLVPAMPLGGLLVVFVALAALNRSLPSAAFPTSGADAALLVANGMSNALGTCLIVMGSRTVPAAEVALMSLLEVGVSPALVWVATNFAEVPGLRTIIAGCLVVATLAAHAIAGRLGFDGDGVSPSCEPVSRPPLSTDVAAPVRGINGQDGSYGCVCSIKR